MFKGNRRLMQGLLKFSDMALELCAILLAYALRFFVFHGQPEKIGLDFYLWMMVLAIPVYFILYGLFELYDFARYQSVLTETEKVIQVNIIGGIFLFLVSFFLRVVDVSRMVILLFVVINTVFALLSRAAIRMYLRAMGKQRRNMIHLLIVGWNDVSGEFYKKITDNLHFGYEVVGFLDDRSVDATEGNLPYLGTTQKLDELLQSGKIDQVVISLDDSGFQRLGRIIESCEKEGVKSCLLPFYARYLPARPYVDEIDGMPLINLHHTPLDNPLNRFVKRAFDLSVALVLTVLLSPLMLITALCIRLSSPGPVIYRQERVGRNKKNFVMYKFRSMRVNDNADMTTWGTSNDSRRTKFGTLIRKLSIDELPQLFNVIKGDMSIVGPRPERPFFVEKFRDEVPLYMLKHLVRPGITGWAQVNGWRGDTSIVERVKCDLFYIENWSFLLDIKILLLTITCGIVNRTEK